MPTSEELSEDTIVHVLQGPMFDRVDLGGCVFAATPHEAGVHRIRLGHVDRAIAAARVEATRRQVPLLEWWIGWNATPAGLAEQLVERGFEAGEVPVLTGMTCDAE